MNDATPTPLRSSLFGIAAAFLLAFTTLHAQGPITENPEGAVRLKRIWYLLGGVNRPYVGAQAGGLGDLNEDGFDDFCVRVNAQEWIFLGAETPSLTPAMIIDSAGAPSTPTPIVGHFTGPDERLIGFINPIVHSSGARFFRFYFYRPDRDSLLRITDYHLTLPGVQPVNCTIIASDLDNDGDDELIIANTDDGHYTKVRIYAGGADFDLSQPTMVMTDDGDVDFRAYGARMHLSDVDGDGLKDMVLGFNYPTGATLKFWWGTPSSPWSWNAQPDRLLLQPLGTIVSGYSIPPGVNDYNGDSLLDRIGYVSGKGSYLWLSRPDGAQRTRPFDSSDYDLFFEGYGNIGTYGYIADSLGRYQMMAMQQINGPEETRGFSGGEYGPNKTWDTYIPGGDGPPGGGHSAGDVNGDGWEDRIVYNDGYGGPGVGAAMIIAGGPYIPNDDPTVGVHTLASPEHTRSFWVWPNPVREVLHIAWRGDLKNPAVQGQLFDMNGRLIAETTLQPWTGAIDWRVEELASGVYLLSILDGRGTILSTTSLLKE